MLFKQGGVSHRQSPHELFLTTFPPATFVLKNSMFRREPFKMNPMDFYSFYLLGHLVMHVRSLVCGWGFCLLCKICVAIQRSGPRPGKSTGPLVTGPPTVRKAIVQMWIAFPPTVLSCFQLAPISITPGCIFISPILPCRCKF